MSSNSVVLTPCTKQLHLKNTFGINQHINITPQWRSSVWMETNPHSCFSIWEKPEEWKLVKLNINEHGVSICGFYISDIRWWMKNFSESLELCVPSPQNKQRTVSRRKGKPWTGHRSITVLTSDHTHTYWHFRVTT